uniref:Vitellogenin n=1 Tax=Ditylenchus dipsaci TaxID=166011 RepID=A0A915DIX1_9BILA
MESFYVVLPSNTKQEGNKSSTFTVRLPQILELDSQWTVAVSSIIYPLSFTSAEQEGGEEEQYVDLYYRKNDPLKNVCRIKLPTLKQSTLTRTKEALEKVFNEEYLKIPEKIRNRSGNKTEISYGFFFNYDLHRFSFSMPPPFVQAKLSNRLAYVLGFTNHLIEDGAIAKYDPDLASEVRQIFCYAPNLVENTIVGNVTAPLLRIINVQGEYGSVTESIYTSEHHHRLSSKRISEISVELRDTSGNLIQFSWGSVILTLHFKKNLF